MTVWNCRNPCNLGMSDFFWQCLFFCILKVTFVNLFILQLDKIFLNNIELFEAVRLLWVFDSRYHVINLRWQVVKLLWSCQFLWFIKSTLIYAFMYFMALLFIFFICFVLLSNIWLFHGGMKLLKRNGLTWEFVLNRLINVVDLFIFHLIITLKKV